MSKQVSKNIFWLTASRVAALVLLLFAYTRLLPYLGPFGSGQYTFVLSYVLIFATIVDFGIQQFITKKISEQPERTREYFLDFFSFEVVVAGFLYALLVALAGFRHFDQPVFFGIALAGLGMVASALTYPFLAVMAANQDLRKVALINFINSLVNIFVMLAVVYFKKYIVFLASITLVFGVIDLALYRIFIKKYLPDLHIIKGLRPLDLGLIKDILRQGWPFALLVGFSAIYNRVDVLIITFLKGYEQTGFYTTAYKIFDLLGFFPSVVSFTLFPFFAALMAKSAFFEVRLNLEKYLRLMFCLALPMAVGGTILSRPLILLLTGNDLRFLPSVPVLAVLIWAPAILFVYIPVNSLVISQLTKKALAITGANVVVNIAGNLLLVPRFGIVAAAAMTVVSELMQGVFYFYFVRANITHFSFFPYTLKPVLASAIMGLVLWQIRGANLPVALAAGVGTYTLSLLATGFFRKEDLNTLKQLFKSQQTQNE